MNFEILVDGPAFRDRLVHDIREAEDRVWIACLSFEADDAGRSVADPLIERTEVDRRVLADAFFTSTMINDRFVYGPANLLDDELWDERRATRAMLEELVYAGVAVRLSHPSGPLGTRFLQRGHKKITVVDDVAYVGGINLSDHNFSWHDVMLRIEDPALVEALAEDLEATWQGRPDAGTRKLDGTRLSSLDGHANPRVLDPLLRRIASASSSIRIVSPYLSPPFLDPIRQASQSGAEVELVTPEANNWPLFRTATLDEARRHGYDVHLYPDRMNHSKALILDDETLVLGSTNFDLFSYRLHEEIVLEFTDPALVEAFQAKVLEPDRDISHRPDDWPGPVQGAGARAGLHAVHRVVQAWAPLARTGPKVVDLEVDDQAPTSST